MTKVPLIERLTLDKQIEVAEAVEAHFASGGGWTTGDWGVSPEGVGISDVDGLRGALCLCLGAAIRLSTTEALGFVPEQVTEVGSVSEALAEHYTRCAGLKVEARVWPERGVIEADHMNRLTHWNDAPERTLADVQALAARVAAWLHANAYAGLPVRLLGQEAGR